jgi:hypothetical protein
MEVQGEDTEGVMSAPFPCIAQQCILFNTDTPFVRRLHDSMRSVKG